MALSLIYSPQNDLINLIFQQEPDENTREDLMKEREKLFVSYIRID